VKPISLLAACLFAGRHIAARQRGGCAAIEERKSDPRLPARVVSLIWWKSYKAFPAVSDFPTFMQRPLL